MTQPTMLDYLGLRCRALNRQPVRRRGADYVLCWLQQTLRGDHNPVVDAAILAGRRLRKPVLVYHGLGEHYPYASDRLHTFILQASRSLESEVTRRGLRFLRYVQRDSKPHPGLVYQLAERATSIIVDDVAAFVSRTQAERVASKVNVAVLAVDGLRLIPEAALGEQLRTTPAFRARAGALREGWLAEPCNAENSRSPFAGDLPVAHDALKNELDIGPLIAQCQIDHTLWSLDRWSGSRRRALQQLDWALECVVPHYAAVRNNPADSNSVTRLSPYLHFGILSPAEVTRAVNRADIGSRHRWKFLDELLTWREYYHHRMAHTARPCDYENVSATGRKTLDDHRSDPREQIYTLAELTRGETGDETWNAAQKQFILEGWMHNNLRMYWGKQLIGWTSNPESAWATGCYLNDRFSLDGRDPATYGSIAWCFSAKYVGNRAVYGGVPTKRDTAMRCRPGVDCWLANYAARTIPDDLYVPQQLPTYYVADAPSETQTPE